MSQTPFARIEAVTVNHNTSRYVELLLRSLYATHTVTDDLTITVMDNGSTDDMTALRTFLAEKHIPLRPSGFPLTTPVNSHGQILQQFVRDHPNADYYLLLDADVCFLEPQTIDTMRRHLDADETLFGVGVRQSWDGQIEVPIEHRSALYERRLHPCCALLRNTALFRKVALTIGFTGVTYHWTTGDEYLDTCELLTRVMQTHGLRHTIVPSMVYHFFSVSYDEQWIDSKHQRCDALLATLRAQG